MKTTLKVHYNLGWIKRFIAFNGHTLIFILVRCHAKILYHPLGDRERETPWTDNVREKRLPF